MNKANVAHIRCLDWDTVCCYTVVCCFLGMRTIQVPAPKRANWAKCWFWTSRHRAQLQTATAGQAGQLEGPRGAHARSRNLHSCLGAPSMCPPWVSNEPVCLAVPYQLCLKTRSFQNRVKYKGVRPHGAQTLVNYKGFCMFARSQITLRF